MHVKWQPNVACYGSEQPDSGVHEHMSMGQALTM